MKTIVLSVAGLVAGASCQAAPPGYGEAADAYKAEVKGADPVLVNGSFVGDIAGSKANRKGDHLAEEAVHEANLGIARREAASGGLRFASPTIYGTVRGDVTIVVQRGAVRGSVTSISR